MARNPRVYEHAPNYTFDSSLKNKFLESIKTYWPDIIPEKLNEDYCGVRPKIQNKDPALWNWIGNLILKLVCVDNFLI